MSYINNQNDRIKAIDINIQTDLLLQSTTKRKYISVVLAPNCSAKKLRLFLTKKIEIEGGEWACIFQCQNILVENKLFP